MPSKCRVSARCCAAPSSIAVWPSCPHACITPGVARAVRERVRLPDRQRVHVGAQPEASSRGPAPQHADHAGFSDAAVHLDAERLEPRRDQLGGAFLLEAELRVRVDVAPPFAHLVVQFFRDEHLRRTSRPGNSVPIFISLALASTARAGGGELQPGADVVGEAGDLGGFTSSRRLAREEIAEVGVAVRRILPPARIALLPRVRRAGHHVADLLRLLARVHEHAVAAAEHLGVDLLRLDAADVHAGPEPLRLDHAHHGGGRGEDHVGAFDARFDGVHRLHVSCCGGECGAAFRPGTEDAHFLEPPHGARGHELGAGLPAGADERERRDVLSREMLEREPARGADAQALHHAVRKHREQRAGLGAEEQHQADPAALAVTSRGERLLDPARLAGDERMRHHVGIDPQRLDAARRPGAAHVLEAVVAARMRRRRDVVHARRKQRLPVRVVAVHRLERGHAPFDGEKPRDFVVAQDKHWSWRSFA